MSNTADKRTVHTDALDTLGTITPSKEKKDAIHIAVDSVTSDYNLFPGAHIKIVDGKAVPAPVGQGHGIVDPYLPGMVKAGQWFWFLMYPRQIKSLRHVWSHPDFPDENIIEVQAKPKESEAEAKLKSIEWLMEFASSMYISYERLMQSAKESDDSDYLVIHGSSASGGIPKEFWQHFKTVTGMEGSGATSFSCSC